MSADNTEQGQITALHKGLFLPSTSAGMLQMMCPEIGLREGRWDAAHSIFTSSATDKPVNALRGYGPDSQFVEGNVCISRGTGWLLLLISCGKGWMCTSVNITFKDISV